MLFKVWIIAVAGLENKGFHILRDHVSVLAAEHQEEDEGQGAAEAYGDADLYKPDMPAPLLKHSYVSPSVATDVMVKKYADGLPLYRQEQQWKRLGVPLKRGTMANWMVQLSQRYFTRFRDRLQEELVKQAVVHADETVLQVLKEEGKDPTSESRMWVYASSGRADRQIRLFDYRDSRKGECAKEFLEGFHGILVTDGYSGYSKVPEVTRAGCWAHMRRKWHEAMPKGEAGQKSLAAQGYRFCNRLFALERKLEDLTDALFVYRISVNPTTFRDEPLKSRRSDSHLPYFSLHRSL